MGRHRTQQLTRRLALLETLQRFGVIEQEGQVEQLQFLGVGLELRHRRRQQLHLVVEQFLHLLGLADPTRIRLDIDLEYDSTAPPAPMAQPHSSSETAWPV